MFIPHQNVYFSICCGVVWRWHILWLIMRHHLSPKLSQRSFTFDTISMNVKMILISHQSSGNSSNFKWGQY